MTTPTEKVAYRKLTGMKRGLGTMSQLALGPDHLLHITSTGYTEAYRRFYLRDIQAMLIVHTARRAIYAAVLGSLALIVLTMVTTGGGGAVGIAIIATIFGGLLIWNHVRGPGCRVVVVTAVQQENVHALCRLPATRRVLAELRPLIEAAQAHLATAPAAASGEPAAADAGLSAPPIPPPLPPPLPNV